nr:hypothetical protein [Rhodococcus sp. NCIMB 12038]
MSVSAGFTMSSFAPIRVSANFGNSVGYDGGSPPISSMWFASFCPTQIPFGGFGMTGVKSAPSIG